MFAFDLAALPEGPRHAVLSRLPSNEVAAFCAVNRAARDMCNAPGFWAEQYRLRHL